MLQLLLSVGAGGILVAVQVFCRYDLTHGVAVACHQKYNLITDKIFIIK